MPLVNCPFCYVRVNAPESIEGKKARCPGCAKTFVLPSSPRSRRPASKRRRLHPAVIPVLVLVVMTAVGIGCAIRFLGHKIVADVKKAQAKEIKPKTRFEKLGLYQYINFSGTNYQDAYKAAHRVGRDQGSRFKMLEKMGKENDAWVLLEGIKDHNASLKKDVEVLLDAFERQLAEKACESALKETVEAIESALGTRNGYHQGVFDGCGWSMW